MTVERRQVGCVRFSYLPFNSEAPRRFRCQPRDAASADDVEPQFVSTSYGEPAYAQLATTCPLEITSGADDEGEMGAWHWVQAPLRLRNLRLALDEYLRFGLEAGIIIAPQQPLTPSGSSQRLQHPGVASTPARKSRKTRSAPVAATPRAKRKTPERAPAKRSKKQGS